MVFTLSRLYHFGAMRSLQDRATAQHHIPIVEHHGLTRGDVPLRVVEVHFSPHTLQRSDLGGRLPGCIPGIDLDGSIHRHA